MQWYSLLPDNLSVIESWIKTFFIFMALFTIGPWALFLIYDLFLYLWRAITYEIPVIGGRARGRERPRAPSLTERPGGDPRYLGIAKVPLGHGDEERVVMDGDEHTNSSLRQRHTRMDEDAGD